MGEKCRIDKPKDKPFQDQRSAVRPGIWTGPASKPNTPCSGAYSGARSGPASAPPLSWATAWFGLQGEHCLLPGA